MFYAGMALGALYGGLASNEGGLGGAIKGAAVGGLIGRYGKRALDKAISPRMQGVGFVDRAFAGGQSAMRLAGSDLNRFGKHVGVVAPRGPAAPVAGASNASKSSSKLRSNRGQFGSPWRRARAAIEKSKQARIARHIAANDPVANRQWHEMQYQKRLERKAAGRREWDKGATSRAAGSFWSSTADATNRKVARELSAAKEAERQSVNRALGLGSRFS